MQEACTAWRQIALKDDVEAACPLPAAVGGENWTAAPLFPEPPGGGLPRALRAFCVYEYGKNDPATLATLDERLHDLVGDELERVDRSCAAVGPASENRPPSDPGGSRWRIFRDHFLDQVGQVRGRFVPAPRRGGSPVRLVFLDTHPDGTIGAEKASSEHGRTLARFARTLLCDPSSGSGDSGCAASISSRLALAIETFRVDDPEVTKINRELGGFFGTIDGLARAVWEEVRDLAEPPETAEAATDRLVLNLSLAWVGERFGGLESNVEDMPVPVQALYRTLEVASCKGALVVAAAGNRTGGPLEETGPLLPGGWEDRPAPGSCTKVLSPERRPRRDRSRRGRGPGEPLIYAVAGVGTDGSPLANARPGSTPPRVAYADHAVVDSAEAGKPTEILTGSSVATAVVSATAAAAWSLAPDLPRAELMAVLHRSGEALGRTADFHGGSAGDPPEVRRVMLCSALAAVCAGDGAACPEDLRKGCSRSLEPPELSSLPADCEAARFEDATRIDAARIARTFGDTSFCRTRRLHFDPELGPPTDPCPFRQFFGITARPYTGPMPQEDGCSACTATPPPPPPSGGDVRPQGDGGSRVGWTVRVPIDATWRGGPLKEAILDIGEMSFALGLKPLDAGECALVEGIDPALLEPGADGMRPPVILRFRVYDEVEDAPVSSVSIPVFVGR